MNPSLRFFQCRGCRYADTILNTTPVCRGSNFSNVINTYTVFCKKKREVVRYPYEKCSLKDEAPKVRIDEF